MDFKPGDKITIKQEYDTYPFSDLEYGKIYIAGNLSSSFTGKDCVIIPELANQRYFCHFFEKVKTKKVIG